LAGVTTLSATITASAQDGAVHPRVAADVAAVNDAYLIGPDAASKLGCRVTWQAIVPLATEHGLTLVSSSPHAVLALNSRNELSLIRAETGDRAWTTSGAEAVDRVIAIAYGINGDTGATFMRTRFRRVPSTAPSIYAGSLIFGTRSGEVVWLNATNGGDYRAYTVDGPRGHSPIAAAPALADNVIVVGSTQGTVVAIEAASGRSLWKRTLLAGVRATPAIGKDLVFVASEDQYLYAFDRGNGATAWKYFTQAPLTTSPFIAGDIVVQDIPGEGFVAFNQNPDGNPGGEVLWKKTGLHGQPIGTLAERDTDALVFWCPLTHQATVVDMKKGDVLRTIALPSVQHLVADSIESDGFLAWNQDGRIERLSPKNKAVVPTAEPLAPATTTAAAPAANSNG
jgi:outer membrane protein assembly factor BamB